MPSAWVLSTDLITLNVGNFGLHNPHPCLWVRYIDILYISTVLERLSALFSAETKKGDTCACNGTSITQGREGGAPLAAQYIETSHWGATD